ncbi:hypothetical protein OMAG_000643 [Candidatus Omnitrophus magneticus]|uniref:Uncharacterized protein n=1 Tax=Candidatus Omnitrophus magneticus TaxID=1609969 RepID=A0A0F0CVM4_9BACT|nr:hypothetical protein OMAG_000643 [Candidatus Omnitrophus magneticus]
MSLLAVHLAKVFLCPGHGGLMIQEMNSIYRLFVLLKRLSQKHF